MCRGPLPGERASFLLGNRALLTEDDISPVGDTSFASRSVSWTVVSGASSIEKGSLAAADPCLPQGKASPLVGNVSPPSRKVSFPRVEAWRSPCSSSSRTKAPPREHAPAPRPCEGERGRKRIMRRREPAFRRRVSCGREGWWVRCRRSRKRWPPAGRRGSHAQSRALCAGAGAGAGAECVTRLSLARH